MGTATDKNIIIPAVYNGKRVVALGKRCFKDKTIVFVDIPDSVTSIGFEAFYGCRSLTSISMGNSVTSIGGNAINSERDFRKTQQKTPNNIENSLQMIA